MAAETNLITKEQVQQLREADFVTQFADKQLKGLIKALGVTRKVEVMEGTTLYVKKVSGTLQDGAVNEGEVIPLSQYKIEKTPVGEITLKKYRKAVSAEAIKKGGFNQAVIETDKALLRDVQKNIRADMFKYLNGSISGSQTATGVGLQAALADAWGKLQTKFEDDAVETVYFLNPTDIANYLGSAQITMQDTFGMKYVEDFLGLGTVLISSQIKAGTFVATAKENIIMSYLSMKGDLAKAFELTTDESGYIGINSGSITKERAQIESLVMNGVAFLPDVADGVIKGTITGIGV